MVGFVFHVLSRNFGNGAKFDEVRGYLQVMSVFLRHRIPNDLRHV